LLSYNVVAAETLRDLVTLTFDLGQWSYMPGPWADFRETHTLAL